MKKYIQFIIPLIVFTLNLNVAFTQTVESMDESSSKLNEIRIDILTPLFAFSEVTYERLLSQRSSVGLSVGIALINDDYHYTNNQYTINPYYRFYFGNKRANGFFLEGNFIFSKDSGDAYTNSSGTVIRYVQSIGNREILYERQNRLSLGLSSGFKIANQYDWQLSCALGYAVSITNKWSRINVYSDQKINSTHKGLLELSLGKRF